MKGVTYTMSVSMIVMACILASYLAFTELMPTLFGWRRKVLVTILYGYAFYRAFRLYTMIKFDSRKTNLDEE
jgi:cytosine/uracil/thiamine/allantoin permease